ncbi:hypothetical protein ABEB36_009256 [Hypothenemus hampei]|uniref:Tc1-like transposase DDE domain-containing protein n=1 Tax=Hypothenemus hampei TaxID=57062 RepID=A0ABD1EGF6_HYPHA
MPKPLSRASKELVASLIRYFEKEKDADSIRFFLPPYHCQFNAIELVWGICKNYYNAHIGRDGKNIKASLEMWREALAKVTGETWKKCIDHTDLEIMKWYNREQIMDTADTTPLIINFDNDDDKSDEWASDS